MSRSYAFAVAVLLACGGISAEAKDFEKLLKGDYAFAGEATCLVSFTGFDANLSPNGPGPWPRVFSFSLQGVRTFNGDGTGTVVARTLSLSHPFALPATMTTSAVFNRGGASSADLQSDFTYTVSPDMKVTIYTPLVTGIVLSGSRTGQTIQITNLPPFTGFIAEGLESLTLAHEVPGAEHHLFSNGDADDRICHRSRFLHERKASKR